MFNSDSSSDSSIASLGDTQSVVNLLYHDDEMLVRSRAKKFIERLYPNETKVDVDIGEANDDVASVEGDGSIKRENSVAMRREMSAADFIPSLPSFGRKKEKVATTDDGADLLRRLESEYIKGEDGERPRTVAVCPEAGSYPMHMRREYDTPVYAGGDDDEGGALTTTNGNTSSPLLPRRNRQPHIVSHDVLMLVFSFLPAHLPTLRSVSSTCRAWRERCEFLAPHWDIVEEKSRQDSYYTAQKMAWLKGDDNSDDDRQRTSTDVSREPSVIAMDALRPRRNIALGDAQAGSDTASNRSDVSSTTAAIQAVAAAIRAENEAAVAEEDPAPDTDTNSDTSSAAASNREDADQFTVPIQPKSSIKLFKLKVGSRREFIINRIQDNYTMKEGISIIYRKKRLFGLYPLMVYLVWISFAAAVAFAMGYLPNALDTDVKIGATFIFGIASMSGIAELLSVHGCCLQDCGYRHHAYTPKPILAAYRVWSIVSVGILCLIVGLLAHRLAAVERLLDEQPYNANGVWSDGSDESQYCPSSANTTFPPALDFSPLSVGTSRYSWLSNRPLDVSFAYDCQVKTTSANDPIGSNTASTNASTCFMNFTVLVAAYTNSLPTGCGSTNPARFIAFDVASGINDTSAFGDHDPLTYFAGGGAVHRGNTANHDGIQIKVPRDDDLFPIWVGWYIDAYRDYWYRPSTSSIGTNATVSYVWAETPSGAPGERNYDAAVSLSGVPWGDNNMPIVPYFGRGGVREMIEAYMSASGGAPKVSGLTYMFQSYNDLRDELIVGIWAVVGTALGGLFVLYSTMWCFRFRHNRLREGPSVFWCNVTSKGVRVVFYVIAYLVCNPVMMLGFGTCYFKDPMPSYCMMSYPSALALFIVGVIFSCCCCVGTCGVIAKVVLS